MDVPKDLNGWIVAIVALMTLWIEVRNRNKDASRVNMQEAIQGAIRPLDDKIVKFSDYHRQHFGDINALTERMARAEEHVTNHEASCIEHRRRIESMFTEIRNKLYE